MVYLWYFLLLYAVLYFFLPMGYPLYEGLRFPIWTFKMKMFPQNGLKPEKHTFGKHPRQYLVHYRPKMAKPETGHVVIYIHGGGWQFGNPEMFRPNAQLLEGLGFHSFFLSHRRVPKYNIRDMKVDVGLGMARVVEVMKKEGIGQHKIILGGVSSGANLAALYYFDRSYQNGMGLPRSLFSGLFLMAPPLNLEGMWTSPTLAWVAGSRKGEMFREASPIHFIEPEETIPTLIVHPEKDGMVPLRSVVAFYEKAQSMDYQNLEFRVLPDMMHLDAASWCFAGHPSQKIVLDWLGKVAGREAAGLNG